jgi:hypothetical protein
MVEPGSRKVVEQSAKREQAACELWRKPPKRCQERSAFPHCDFEGSNPGNNNPHAVCG